MTHEKETGCIWAVFKHYHPNFSGIAIQAEQILCYLSKKGYSINVIAAADHLAAKMAGQELVRKGLRIRYLPVIASREWRCLSGLPRIKKITKYIDGIMNNLSFNLGIMTQLIKEGKRGDIVQLYSTSEFSFLIARIAKQKGMHPIILMSLLGSDDPISIQNNTKGPSKYFKLSAFTEAEKLIALCSAQTKSCRLAGVELDKVAQIPCAVDVEKFFPQEDEKKLALLKKLNLKSRRRYVIFVGSAKHRKGIDVLIEAFIRIAIKIDDVDLIIVGPNDFKDGTRHHEDRQKLAEELSRVVARSGCADRVHWVGRVENVNEYLQVAHVFCFPTRREGFGIVIAEAMATGLPIVTALIEGVTTDHINRDEGFLINGHEAEDYADKIVMLLEDSELVQKMGNAAFNKAVKDYNLNFVSRRFEEVYQSLAS